MPARRGAAPPRVTLKPGREKSLLARHPGCSPARSRTPTPITSSGATVDLHAADGAWLARARVVAVVADPRACGRSRRHADRAAFFRARVDAGGRGARGAVDAEHDAARLVHAEADGLPGVVVDRYADTLVVQLLAAGAERHRDAIVDALVAATGARAVVERSDAEVRALEGLPVRSGVLRGRVDGPVTMREAASPTASTCSRARRRASTSTSATIAR